jgi:NADP-dependent 3-hydroxy acid dehydrogenase YdfG
MERSPAGNSTYPKGGVSCSADSFVQAESSVLRMKFRGKSPALRVAAKRYKQLKTNKLGKVEPA